MCFLEEVKGQKGCRRSEGLASSSLVRTLDPPRAAATQGENTGRILRAYPKERKSYIILYNLHKLLLKSAGRPIRGLRERSPQRNNTNEARVALTYGKCS